MTKTAIAEHIEAGDVHCTELGAATDGGINGGATCWHYEGRRYLLWSDCIAIGKCSNKKIAKHNMRTYREMDGKSQIKIDRFLSFRFHIIDLQGLDIFRFT